MPLIPLLLSLSVARAEDAFDAFKEEAGEMTAAQYLRGLPQPRYRSGIGFDPTKVDDYKPVSEALQLTREESALLKQHGFAIVDHEQRYSFGSMYYAIYARDLPVLVTTDSVLHAMHRSFDDLLSTVEARAMAPTIGAVLSSAHEALSGDDEAAKDVDLYLTVARNLLAGAGAPVEHEGTYGDQWDGTLLVESRLGNNEAVLALLEKVQAGGLEVPGGGSTVLYGAPRMVDYSQFRPRGHYTDSAQLSRYFRALMWLGRVDCGFQLKAARQAAAAARLSALVAQTGGDADLAEMGTLIDWLIGESDAFGVPDMLDALDAAGLEPAELPAAYDQLAPHLGGEQRIRSQVVLSNTGDAAEVQPPAVYQLFGQRFIIDSFVLSKVVFDSIVFKGQKVERMMPSGLDVAAALGNPEAGRLLSEELEAYPYAKNLWAAGRWVDALPEATWSQSVYNTWLDALRHMDDDVTGVENMPQAMQTEAWQRKQLQAQLASWAELRHDTILYAQQSYTAYPTCEYPAGFVEPYPAVYASVGRFAEATAAALGAVRFPSAPDPDAVAQLLEDQQRFLGRMAEITGTLEKLAEKELAGQRFTPAESAFLKKTIDARGAGSGPPRYDGWYPELFYSGGTSASEWAPEVADVHTDPASGRVLQVATGDADFLVMAVDNEGDRRLYVGPVYSYYEFHWPVIDRLTDLAWQEILRSDRVPARPSWMQPLLSTSTPRTLGR